jgi:signal transduction histidine kinase
MEQRESVSLYDVVMNVREMMAPILGERHQSIEISCDTSDKILADSEKAERLIRNLIENASQYGESPGIIGCRVMQKKDEMLLVVENDGVPIPDQEKQRVFIPYYRILGTGSSGSGLGLAIVEEIVRQCGGRIRVEDKSPNNGARFVLTFPLV